MVNLNSRKFEFFNGSVKSLAMLQTKRTLFLHKLYPFLLQEENYPFRSSRLDLLYNKNVLIKINI